MKKTISIITLIAVLGGGFLGGTPFFVPEAEARSGLDRVESTITASPTSVAADGESYSTISVRTVDGTGTPIPGMLVELFSNREADVITLESVSDIFDLSGTTTFRVSSSIAGTSTFSAVVGSTRLSDTATVTFTSVFPRLALPVSSERSTITASPDSIPANGVSYSTITVTAMNTVGGTVSGKNVTLFFSRIGDILTTISDTTDGDGEATFRVSSSNIGSTIFGAIIDGEEIDEEVTIDFTSGVIIPRFILPVSPANSTVEAAPAFIVADGVSQSIISVIAMNVADARVDISTIDIISSRGDEDSIVGILVACPESNEKYFGVSSLVSGTSTITATVNGVDLSTVEVEFVSEEDMAGGDPVDPIDGSGDLDPLDLDIPLDDPGEDDPEAAAPEAPVFGDEGDESSGESSSGSGSSSSGDEEVELADELVVGDLFKEASSTAVYYYAEDGKRYVFPTSAVYFSWYNDFEAIKTVTRSQVTDLSLGGNVLARPGRNLVQFVSMDTPFRVMDPKVYVLSESGQLRWLADGSVASSLYGSDWETKIVAIPEIYKVDYNNAIVGAQVDAVSDYTRSSIESSVTSFDNVLDR